MNETQMWHNEIIGKKVVEALKKKSFDAVYIPTKEDARQMILDMISADASIGLGGSVTLRELDIIDEFNKRGNTVYNHSLPTLDNNEKMTVRRNQLTADYFLTSTNAVTFDGQLVNYDGTGNRVAAMIFGPKKTIIIAGINKIVKSVDSALERIETKAAPLNNKRLNLPNPCTKTGVCEDCQGSTRICNVVTIMKKKPNQSNITVMIIGEELGM